MVIATRPNDNEIARHFVKCLSVQMVTEELVVRFHGLKTRDKEKARHSRRFFISERQRESLLLTEMIVIDNKRIFRPWVRFSF